MNQKPDESMHSDDNIRQLLEEMKRAQDTFLAEWRAAREDTLRKEEAVREEQARLKAEAAARQKQYRIEMIILFAIFAFVLWQVNRPPYEPRRPAATAPAK